MLRLSRYIFGQITGATLNVFLLILFIGWLTQVLNQFSIVTVKGQNVLTFLGQTGLLLPTIAAIILPACLMLGLARALRQFDQSRELHTIHGAGRFGALAGAVAGAALVIVLWQGALIHFAEPLSTRAAAAQMRAINADLIARASVAGVFTEIEPGVTLRIDRRTSGGEMEGFFLHDDRNPEFSQTILAARASVARLGDGIDVSLEDGSIAFRDKATGNLSSVNFVRYGLGAADIIEIGGDPTGAQFRTTPQLLALLAENQADTRVNATLHLRFSLPIYAATLATLCFFALGFPGNATQKRRVPIELPLLGFAIVIQGLGVAMAEGAFRDASLIPVLYAVPLLPLIPAAWLAFRRLGRAPRIRLPVKQAAA